MQDANDGYEYDVFVSYRSGFLDAAETIPLPTRTWTREVFAPELRRWLAAEVGASRVFVERDEIQPGAQWPEDLAEKLLRSKVLISVLDATYCDSLWCMAELRSMVERERVLGCGPGGEQALVIPIRFADRHRFPEEIKTRSLIDFGNYASLDPRLSGSAVYRELVEQVRQLCGRLQPRIDAPPQWDPSWPIVRSQPHDRPPFALPEL
ncbi:MAG: TIR domain-containing protein [Nannocystaceae bacterium]